MLTVKGCFGRWETNYKEKHLEKKTSFLTSPTPSLNRDIVCKIFKVHWKFFQKWSLHSTVACSGRSSANISHHRAKTQGKGKAVSVLGWGKPGSGSTLSPFSWGCPYVPKLHRTVKVSRSEAVWFMRGSHLGLEDWPLALYAFKSSGLVPAI